MVREHGRKTHLGHGVRLQSLGRAGCATRLHMRDSWTRWCPCSRRRRWCFGTRGSRCVEIKFRAPHVIHRRRLPHRFAAYEAASMPGNALNRETWSQLTSFSCPNNSWTAGYGDASWQIQTNAECVAAAEADASCATPLVLNIGWDACYCATDACDAPVATSYMTTYRYAGDSQGLAPLGERYENFTWESPCRRRHERRRCRRL